MSIIIDAFRKKRTNGEPTAKDRKQYHNYGSDLMADGFISPIVLPADRLRELQGDMTLENMASKCRMDPHELQMLMEHDYLEPKIHQLVSISLAFQVSILWLLGYHAAGIAPGADGEMLRAIGKRNAAEASLNDIQEKGFLKDILISFNQKRLVKYNLAVAATASRIVAMEHLPLSEEELYLLKGQPVFVEHTNGEQEWGLVFDHCIHALTGNLSIPDNGVSYLAYQMPEVRERSH